jgi:hypothetical protein
MSDKVLDDKYLLLTTLMPDAGQRAITAIPT